MKKLSTISLFIFGVVVTSIMTAGLVFYQNSKTNSNTNSQTGSLVRGVVDKITSSGKTVTLNMSEISKHNKQSDCWMLINGKVYDITSYFGSHPGGNGTMSATCGKDATDAYMTKDPYATSNPGGSAHSSRARNLLTDYYLGDLNQVIGQVTKTKTSSTTTVNDMSANNTKTSQVDNNQTTNNTNVKVPTNNVNLSLSEIAKHNKISDCWMLISGKVYNITSYFGSHPGGNSAMLTTCGKDATDAYMTKDPYATSSGSRSAHSSNARGLLSNYYIGDLNQSVGQQNITNTNSVIPPASNAGDDWEDD